MAALLIERHVDPRSLGVDPPPEFGDVVMAYLADKTARAADVEVRSELRARLNGAG